MNLEYLNVRGSEVTSRAFEHLAKMKNLLNLDAGFSRLMMTGLMRWRRWSIWKS